MRWSIIRLIWVRELRDQLRDRRTLFMIAVLPIILYPVAGIGLNVNQTRFPEDLKDIATSLSIETGREHSKDDLMDRIVAECLRYAAFGKHEILRGFEEHSSYVRGKNVLVDGTIHGITAGLDEDGFLLLQTETGLKTILSGGVRPI